MAKVERKTKETEISIQLIIDGTGNVTVSTKIGFLDHMLEAMASHGVFDLEVTARGDLHVDAHHVTEDVAITLGQAFNKALDDKKGIRRIAHAWVPMDDALAFVAVDLSGRPFTSFKATWHAPYLGSFHSNPMPTSLIEHFLRSFATSARITIHAEIVTGNDDHHQVEALFKALGRALDQASRLDPKQNPETIPSTKGVL